MNGVIIILIAIVVLLGAYLIYGRWLTKKWGIDPKAKTPAYTEYDGVDYVPAEKSVVFGHQFASIAGSGPIQAAIFGWVPVLLCAFWAAFSLAQYRIFPLCTLPSKTKVTPSALLLSNT